MDDQLKVEINEYLKLVTIPSFFPTDPGEQLKKFNEASFEILDEYPNISLSPRMIVLQAFYNAEGEEEGVAMMHRQGIQDYTVKDVKAVLKRPFLNPFVLRIIENMNKANGKQTSGRTARLI